MKKYADLTKLVLGPKLILTLLNEIEGVKVKNKKPCSVIALR